MGITCTPSGETSITAIARELLPPPPPPAAEGDRAAVRWTFAAVAVAEAHAVVHLRHRYRGAVAARDGFAEAGRGVRALRDLAELAESILLRHRPPP